MRLGEKPHAPAADSSPNIPVEPTPNSLRSYVAAAIGRGSLPGVRRSNALCEQTAHAINSSWRKEVSRVPSETRYGHILLGESQGPTIAGPTMKVVNWFWTISPMGGVLRSYISNIPT